MCDLDEYKLKSVNDIVKFINYDALNYEENKDFLAEISKKDVGRCNIFEYLNIDIVLYPRFGTFILKSKGYGKKLMELLHNDYCGLTELKIKKSDIEYIQSIIKKFDIDLIIKQERFCGKWIWRAFLQGKGIK